MLTIDSLKENSVPIAEYIDKLITKSQMAKEQLLNYKINQEITDKIKNYREKYFVFVFSAEWCPDCFRSIPILALLNRETDLDVRIFGGLIKSDDRRSWKIPPSPKEVLDFDVKKIPLISILDNAGNIIGNIIENPPRGLTLEEAILRILEETKTSSI